MINENIWVFVDCDLMGLYIMAAYMLGFYNTHLKKHA